MSSHTVTKKPNRLTLSRPAVAQSNSPWKQDDADFSQLHDWVFPHLFWQNVFHQIWEGTCAACISLTAVLPSLQQKLCVLCMYVSQWGHAHWSRLCRQNCNIISERNLNCNSVTVFDKELLLSVSKLLVDQPCLMWASKQHWLTDWLTDRLALTRAS